MRHRLRRALNGRMGVPLTSTLRTAYRILGLIVMLVPCASEPSQSRQPHGTAVDGGVASELMYGKSVRTRPRRYLQSCQETGNPQVV